MGITINLQTERGEPIDSITDTFNALHRIIPKGDPDLVLIDCIDWYGDTTFNHLQMARFIAEWGRVLDGAIKEGATALHSKIEEMAKRCETESRLYLRFVGD
jgi:hypothetical protein